MDGATATEIQSRAVFDQFLADCRLKETISIDELAAAVIADGQLSLEYRAHAVLHQVKKDLRRRLQKMKDSAGDRLWHSVTDEDPATGQAVSRYKQIQFFERDDYVRVWKYWDAVEDKAARMKSALERRFGKRFEGEQLTQLTLPYGEVNETAVLKPSTFAPPSQPR